MSDIYQQWVEGDVGPQEALRALCSDLGEVESQIKPLDQERAGLRRQIEHIVAYMPQMKASVDGTGRLEISAPSQTISYDRKALDELIMRLVDQHPDIAAAIHDCRKESSRAGTLRITPEKKATL